jgi:hypothetical protein
VSLILVVLIVLLNITTVGRQVHIEHLVSEKFVAVVVKFLGTPIEAITIDTGLRVIENILKASSRNGATHTLKE